MLTKIATMIRNALTEGRTFPTSFTNMTEITSFALVKNPKFMDYSLLRFFWELLSFSWSLVLFGLVAVAAVRKNAIIQNRAIPKERPCLPLF
jgi:hypothetical protein